VSSIGCGGVVSLVPDKYGAGGTYRGTDGVLYRVGNTRCYTTTQGTPNGIVTMSIEIDPGQPATVASLVAQGVVLFQGKEVATFYGANAVVGGTSNLSGVKTVKANNNLPGALNNVLPAGQYCILTFKIATSSFLGTTPSGEIQICLSGSIPAPAPTSPLVPPPSPTSRPVTPPTPTPTSPPTPTATPIPANPVPPALVADEVQYTLSYSEGVKGWPSFYSYSPDWMIGMNNYFYSFKGGNLYRHNTNEARNNFYGVQYNSTLTSVINKAPLDAKLFRNISLESDEPWSTSLSTDLDNPAFIDASWYELKEGSWYSSIKNTSQVPTTLSNFSSRSISGIGRCDAWSGLSSSRQFNFPMNPFVEIGSQVSIGDYLYYNNELTNTPQFAGQITQININLTQNINNIVINADIAGSSEPINGNPFVISVKDNTAESHGILGHYCLFTIENYGPSPTELFAVQAELMKSYP